METEELASNMLIVGTIIIAVVVIAIIVMIAKFYKKASQGEAIVRTGVGGTKVSFAGMMVVPVLHKMEKMDISLRTIVISRLNKDGLICKDNMRADIKVAFFVRVNQMKEDVIKVAQSVGCARASNQAALNELFEAKFSEALKTVGKKFDFVDLYNKRDEFRQEILNLIGKHLNGYILDDAAIDYLEQTPVSVLSSSNILDAEGIKKITELTATQNILSNQIQREEEKTIKKQDVEAREAILELDKQLAEKEEKQKREISNIRSRENAEIVKVHEEERLKSQRARISTDEELQVAEQNKERQVIVAAKNKERTDAIQTEQVEKDKQLEINERERIVTLAQIEKEKALEIEKKNIQEVIRERVAIEKTVVDEEEKIKDTRAYAEADRNKEVAVKLAEQQAQAQLVLQIKSAEAAKEAAEHEARKKIIEAEASQQAANQEAEAIKILADAEATKQAAVGLAEAKVITAKADALEKQGESEASVIEAKAIASAKGIEVESAAQAEAENKLGLSRAKVELEKGKSEAEVINVKAAAIKEEGLAHADVMREKLLAEAEGIKEKAAAMKQLDGVGQEHEEFKLKLNKDKEVDLAQINIQKDIADAQAAVLSEALQHANIDIVGGEQVFFDKIINAVSNAKMIDQYTQKSEVIGTVSSQLLDGSNGANVLDKVKTLLSDSNLKTEDVKNLTISALLMKLIKKSDNDADKGLLNELLTLAKKFGFDQNSSDFLLD